MLQKHVFNFLNIKISESNNTISNNLKKKPNQKLISEEKRSRSASRLLAIQILYNYFLLNEKIEDLISKYMLSFESDLNELFFIDNFDKDYFENIIKEFLVNNQSLESIINSFLKSGWNIERMSIIDKAILNIGLVEIKIMPNTPIKTIISEYVEMAYQLGGEPGFINYSLDSYSKNFNNNSKTID